MGAPLNGAAPTSSPAAGSPPGQAPRPWAARGPPVCANACTQLENTSQQMPVAPGAPRKICFLDGLGVSLCHKSVFCFRVYALHAKAGQRGQTIQPECREAKEAEPATRQHRPVHSTEMLQTMIETSAAASTRAVRVRAGTKRCDLRAVWMSSEAGRVAAEAPGRPGAKELRGISAASHTKRSPFPPTCFARTASPRSAAARSPVM